MTKNKPTVIEKEITIEEAFILELAKFMHEIYEDKARLYGWETQEKSRVPFEKLPPENAKTMLAVAKEVLGWFTQKEMASIVGYSARGLGKNPASPKLQDDLARLVQLINKLRELLDGDMSLVRIWLKAPHPSLANAQPIEYLEEGHLELVEGLVHAIEVGQLD